eukprot:4835482-Pyramimonas_sp.AAC.1
MAVRKNFLCSQPHPCRLPPPTIAGIGAEFWDGGGTLAFNRRALHPRVSGHRCASNCPSKLAEGNANNARIVQP